RLAGTVTRRSTRMSGPTTLATASPAGCQAWGPSIQALRARLVVPRAADVNSNRSVTRTIAPAPIILALIQYRERGRAGPRARQGVPGGVTAQHRRVRRRVTLVEDAAAALAWLNRTRDDLPHAAHAEGQASLPDVGRVAAGQDVEVVRDTELGEQVGKRPVRLQVIRVPVAHHEDVVHAPRGDLILHDVVGTVGADIAGDTAEDGTRRHEVPGEAHGGAERAGMAGGNVGGPKGARGQSADQAVGGIGDGSVVDVDLIDQFHQGILDAVSAVESGPPLRRGGHMPVAVSQHEDG